MLKLASTGLPEAVKCSLITCPYHQHRLGLPGHEGVAGMSVSAMDVREEVAALASAALRAASSHSLDFGKPRASWSHLAQRYLNSTPSSAVAKAKPRLGIVRGKGALPGR